LTQAPFKQLVYVLQNMPERVLHALAYVLAVLSTHWSVSLHADGYTLPVS
jgi:hypothetical protein